MSMSILVFVSIFLTLNPVSAKTLEPLDHYVHEGNTDAPMGGTIGHGLITTKSGAFLSIGSDGFGFIKSPYLPIVRRSVDQGETWTTTYIGKFGDTFLLPVLTEDGTIFLTGDRGRYSRNTVLFRSGDDGRTWTEITVPFKKTCGDERFHTLIPQANRLLLYGLCIYPLHSSEKAYNYDVLESLDNGTSWHLLLNRWTVSENDYSGTQMVVNSKGELISTDNRGNLFFAPTKDQNQWETLYTSANREIDAIGLSLFLDRQDTLYLGYEGKLQVSHDNGKTLKTFDSTNFILQTPKEIPNPGFVVRNFFQSKEGKVYALVNLYGSKSKNMDRTAWSEIYYSIDHGESWHLNYSSYAKGQRPLILESMAEDRGGNLLVTGTLYIKYDIDLGKLQMQWLTYRLIE